MPVVTRDRIILAFQEYDEYKDDKSLPEAPDFLVAPFHILAVGHNCTRAFRVIIMEPAWKQSSEKQAHGRVSRLGQENKESFSYRLICPKVPVESAIVTRQIKRLELQDLTFNYVPDPLNES